MTRKRTERDGPTIWLVRQPQGLVPASATDREWLEQYRIGSTLIVTLHEPRNESQSKAYWAMLNEVAKGLGTRAEALHFEIKIRGGFADELATWGGGTRIIPRSMSEMGAAEITELFRTAERLFAEQGIDVEELRASSRRKAGLAAPLED